jgi:hypothetical protein
LFFLIAEPLHARNGVVLVNVKAAMRHALTPALPRVAAELTEATKASDALKARETAKAAERARALEALEHATEEEQATKRQCDGSNTSQLGVNQLPF